MLQWLYDSVNWLISQVSAIFSTVHGFISNPYPFIAMFLDWVYNRAVNFVNAVKKEIADWTYGLYVDLVNWRNWFYSLINNTILPVIANVNQWLNNLPTMVVNLVVPMINNLIGTFNSWVGWIQSAIANAIALATNVYNLVATTIVWQINNLVAGFGQLLSLISGFNFQQVWGKIGEFTLFVNNVPLLIHKVVLDSLLDWIEEKLAEALE